MGSAGRSWIKGPKDEAQPPHSIGYFRREFYLPAAPHSAWLQIASDHACHVWVNGREVGRGTHVSVPGWMDLRHFLTQGDNVIAITGYMPGGKGEGLVGCLDVHYQDGSQSTWPLDHTWRVSMQVEPGWTQPGFHDTHWAQALERGQCEPGQPPAEPKNRPAPCAYHLLNTSPIRKVGLSMKKLLGLATVLCTLFLLGCVSYAAVPEEAVAIVATFTEHLQAGRFVDAASMFSPEIQAMLPPAQLEAVWKSLPAQVGEIKSLEEPYVVSADTVVKLRQPVHFTAADLDLSLAVNQALQIIEFLLVPAVPRAAMQAAASTAPYVHMAAFSESELTFGAPAYPLQGTLTMPHGEGPFPAVVLVHGSGPNDRDETIGPNKPFRDVAWGLASRGIAVFRYDKRTLVHGRTMSFNEINVENEVLADAVAAIELLTTQEKVDSQRIYVVGHSMGGTFAPVIAQRAPQIAGLVIMAGAARPLYELVLDQVNYLAGLDGVVSPEEQAQINAIAADVERVRNGQLNDQEVALGTPAHYWQPFRTLDPVAITRTLTQPVLILQGQRDHQVTQSDYALWEQGLRDLHRVTFHQYSDLNHLFMPGKGPSTPQEYTIPGYVAGVVVTDIADWILAH